MLMFYFDIVYSFGFDSFLDTLFFELSLLNFFIKFTILYAFF